MSGIVTRGLGVGGLTTQGYGQFSETRPLMFPLEGSLSGGDQFGISGGGSNSTFVDKFLTIGAAWIGCSTGSGTATAHAGLALALGTAGGKAGIQSAAAYKNFDLSIEYEHTSDIASLSPTTQITLCELRTYLNDTSYFSVAHMWDPAKGMIARASSSLGGTSSTSDLSLKNRGATLRLVRFGGRVQAWAGSKLIVDHKGWSPNDAHIEISCSAPSLPVAFSCSVASFMPSILVTFGDEIAPATMEAGASRIVGYTPVAAKPGSVDVAVHTMTSSTLVDGQFEYLSPLQLTVSEQGGSTIIVTNDKTLRDTSSLLPGLRL